MHNMFFLKLVCKYEWASKYKDRTDSYFAPFAESTSPIFLCSICNPLHFPFPFSSNPFFSICPILSQHFFSLFCYLVCSALFCNFPMFSTAHLVLIIFFFLFSLLSLWEMEGFVACTKLPLIQALKHPEIIFN
ncbi:hypothetical protein XELAEV_18031096mg [Xenopus laevis]|uniref:Uncharacterized protein n=1 Tax=Xenopus laevis TaxID=8355 RepID=A0A974CLZ0_XENLA|nr:hypothetical protein XELAEV_18031096mg [Xenopus laevis]